MYVPPHPCGGSDRVLCVYVFQDCGVTVPELRISRRNPIGISCGSHGISFKTGRLVEEVILYTLCGRFLRPKKSVWSLVTFCLR